MEMDDGQAGYYNDLLNRVDTTITQNRSAYGGREHSGDDESSSSTNWFGGENRRIHFHTYALWGPEGLLPAETRGWLASLYIVLSCAVSLEMSRDGLEWAVAWILTTIMVHTAIIGARLAAERVERYEARKLGFAVSIAAFSLWIIVRLATTPAGQLRAGMRVFVAVDTLGFILAEAVARIVVSRCDPDALRPARQRSDDDDHLQYAAL